MKNMLALCFVVLACIAAAPAAQAHDHDGGHFFFGFNAGAPYYPGYYQPYWGPSYYYEPAPAVIYQQPAPQTVYIQQQPQTVYVQQPQQAAPTADVPTYVDAKGRTCRNIDVMTPDGTAIKGKACLRPDGTWHTVD